MFTAILAFRGMEGFDEGDKICLLFYFKEFAMRTNLKKYFMEFIGTYFLMLTIGCVIVLGTVGVIPAIAIGAALMIMVYAGGYVSGGHYNPAVSLGAAIRKALSWKHLVPYWLFQFLGGLCAALTIFLLARSYVSSVPAELDTGLLMLGEFLFTFALVFVVLHTATTLSTEGNSYYGLAIGATVMTGIFAVGGICAAAFNPAVAVGLGILGLVTWKTAAFTILANFLGAIAAAFVFHMTHIECCD